MRHVLNLVVVAAFAVAATLMVGCGDTAKKDATPATDTWNSSAKTEAPASVQAPEAVAGEVSQVSFAVTGMTWPNTWGSKIKKALAELPGVTVDEVIVGTVTVSGDIDSDAVIKAIEGAGFEATVDDSE